MFSKHKLYYTIEVQDEDTYMFVCSYSSFDAARDKVNELTLSTGLTYRILKIEKDIEEVS